MLIFHSIRLLKRIIPLENKIFMRDKFYPLIRSYRTTWSTFLLFAVALSSCTVLSPEPATEIPATTVAVVQPTSTIPEAQLQPTATLPPADTATPSVIPTDTLPPPTDTPLPLPTTTDTPIPTDVEDQLFIEDDQLNSFN